MDFCQKCPHDFAITMNAAVSLIDLFGAKVYRKIETRLSGFEVIYLRRFWPGNRIAQPTRLENLVHQQWVDRIEGCKSSSGKCGSVEIDIKKTLANFYIDAHKIVVHS